MYTEQLLNNVHFQSPAELMLGAVCGTIAGFILIYWLGDHMDQIMGEIREVGRVFLRRKSR